MDAVEDEARLRDLRSDVLTAFHILDEEGQNSGIGGHVTARLPGEERLLGHGYGLAFDEVRDETIHEADFDLNVAGDGKVNPSLAFHVALYRRRPDVGAIVHTHGRHAIALSASGARFEPVYQSALMLWQHVAPYDRYDGIIENEEVGTHMADTLGDKSVLHLRNHGIVAVGASLKHAVSAAVVFEENCAIQLMAMQAGTLQGFPGDDAPAARDFLASPKVVDMRWQQLTRKAARSRPFLSVPQ